MKTQISRDTFRGRKRYSGVYQQQGRMIVDADVNEQVDISKTRLDDALHDVIGSGVPESGGLDIASDGEGGIEIVPGRVYVDGIPAEVHAPAGQATVAYDQQEDFPHPPPLPLGVVASPPASPPEGTSYSVYVDVWERAVLSLEDPELLDAGLHGADTCTRTRTMAQIKWCPAGWNPEDITFNPRIGNAELTLELRDATTSADPCDPCAEVVDLDAPAGSFLFRLEVHDYARDAGGNRRLTLKWSSENGAEQYAVSDVPTDFTAGQWVYEFYNRDCETHLGWHLAGAAGFPERGVLVTRFTDAPSATSHPYVRRWDGYCVLIRTGGVWALATDALGDGIGIDRGVSLRQTLEPVSRLGDVNVGDQLVLNLDRFELTLTLNESGFDRSFVPGDFWLAPVRENDASGDRVLDGATPHGIEHHYMLLADVDGNVVTHPKGGVCNRYAFPTLTNITASGICFDNTCPDLFGADAENLQDALTNLCSQLDASDVAYREPVCPPGSPNPSLRALLEAKLEATWPDVDEDGVTTVKDVLDALLCHLDAARLPFDAAASGARWEAINEGGPLPQTTQEAVDALVQNLDADDLLLDKSAPDLCADLRPAEVVTVQDALNVLCRSSGGGCVQSVGPGGAYASLDQALQALQSEAAISLCLLPGDHVLSVPLQGAGRSTIRIVGSGIQSSRILMSRGYSLAADEVTLEGFSLVAAPNQALVIEATRANVRESRFERMGSKTGASPFVMIRGESGTLLHWSRNELMATLNLADVGIGARILIPSTQVVGTRSRLRTELRDLASLEPGLQSAAYERALELAARDIAALDPARRRRWAETAPANDIAALSSTRSTYLVTRHTETGRSIPLASARLGRESSEVSPREAAEEFYRVLALSRTSAEQLRTSLDRLMRALASSDVDRGLALAGNGVGGGIELSVFDADVVLNATAERPEVLEPSHLPRDGGFGAVVPGANLHLSGNRLQRVISLIPAEALDANGTVVRPVPGYRSAFVSENVFAGIENGLVAVRLNMQGNHYEVTEARSTVAVVLGEFGAFTANWAAEPSEIQTSILTPSHKSSSGNLQIGVS